MSLNRIYEIVVLINFLYSVYIWIFKGKSKQQFYFFLYLLLVLLVDVIPVNFPELIIFERNIAFVGFILLSVLYFGLIYFKTFTHPFIKITILVFMSVLIFFNLYKLVTQNVDQLDFIHIISLPILFIFFSIAWYIYKLRNVNETRIIDDFLFWISTGLLIWSVFFIFRAIPMYFLQKNDPELLAFVINAFSIVNIITYTLFFTGLTFIKNERAS
jgi:hypothetical protein